MVPVLSSGAIGLLRRSGLGGWLDAACLPSPSGYLTPRKKRSARLFVRTPNAQKAAGGGLLLGTAHFWPSLGCFSKLFDDFNYAYRRSDRIGCGSRSILHRDQEAKVREGHF